MVMAPLSSIRPNQQTRTSTSRLPSGLIQALLAGRQGQAQAPGRQVSRVPAALPPRLAQLRADFEQAQARQARSTEKHLQLQQAAKNEQMRQQLFGANPMQMSFLPPTEDVRSWMNPQNVNMPGYSVLEETEPQSRTQQLPITPRYEDPLNRSGYMQAKQQFLGDTYTPRGPNISPQDRALTMGGIKWGEQVSKAEQPRQIITKPRVIRKKRQMGLGGEGDTE